MRFTVIIMATLCWVAAGPVQAEIYTWRDASGKMVFSDQPPEDRSVRYRVERKKQVQGSSKGASDAASMRAFRERQRRLLDAMQKDREQRKRDLQLAEQKKLKEQENCDLVRRQLHGFQTAGPVYKDNPDGSRTWLEDGQRDDFIVKYKKFIDEHCL